MKINGVAEGTATVTVTDTETSKTKTIAVTVTTASANGTFTDPRDNTTYRTVTIGNQIWMAENLKYLPSVNKPSEESYTEAKYYVYGYNGIDVAAAKQEANYETFEMSLGMSQSQADKYDWRGTNEGSKLAGNGNLWINGDLKNNSQFGTSGFTALPGGYRYRSGLFGSVGYSDGWWSATEDDSRYAYRRCLICSFSYVGRGCYVKEVGFSVRCVRDN